MPKRIIDGERTWKSDKVRKIEPESYRPEYTWMIALANDVGTFECDPLLVWGQAYAINRPSITKEDVAKFLDSFEKAKLLYRWDVDGKTWGCWIGMDRPGLLPKPSERHSKGPRPETAELERFLGVKAAGEPREIATGLGLGFGTGLGIGESEEFRGVVDL